MHLEPTPGRYRHYKGGEYEVVGSARHSETDELLVVYRCLYDNNSLWVRPRAMFMETLIVDGREVPRFAPLKRAKSAELIANLQLLRHPEEGWYRENYRSPGRISGEHLPEQFGGDRSFSTAIYFLLERGDISALHRIRSDEQWHFYAGEPLTVHVITPEGEYYQLRLGGSGTGGSFQAVVPAGYWFGALSEGDYSLAGCSVAPGFDFADFEMGNRAELLRSFPQHGEIIRLLTRDSE